MGLLILTPMVSSGIEFGFDNDKNPKVNIQGEKGITSTNISVNMSDYWDNMNTINSTQMEDNDGVLNILETWLTDFVTTLGNTLYSGIEWDYNQSSVATMVNWTTNGTALKTIVSQVNISNDLNVGGDIATGRRLSHLGDADTYLEYTPDQMNYVVGGISFWKFIEGGDDIVVVNPDGFDIDFKMNALGGKAWTWDGGTGRLGLGVDPLTPTHTLTADGGVNVTMDLFNKGFNISNYLYNQTASSIYYYNQTLAGNVTGNYLNLSGTNANQNINISPYNLTAKTGIFIGDVDEESLFGYPNARIGTDGHITGRILLEYELAGTNSLWQIDNGGDHLRFLNDSHVFVRINKSGIAIPSSHDVCIEAGVCLNDTANWNYNQSAVADITKWLYNQSDGAGGVWSTNETALWNSTTRNVGIGTATPESKLHLEDGTGLVEFKIESSGDTYSSLLFEDDDTIYGFINSTVNDIKIGHETINFYSGSGFTNAMTIDSKGEVGIGTATPSNKTEWQFSAGDGIKFTNDGGNGGNTGQYMKLNLVNAAGLFNIASQFALDLEAGNDDRFDRDLTFSTNDTTRMTIDGSTGYVGVGISTPGYKLHVNSEAVDNVAFFRSSDANARIFLHDDTGYNSITTKAGELAFEDGAGATENMRIDADGNVGIGTNNPLAKFHIKDSTGDTANEFVLLENWSGASSRNSVLMNITGLISDDNGNTYGISVDLRTEEPTPQLSQYGIWVNVSGATNNYAGIFENGLVGIGTRTPSQELNVVGSFNLTGNSYIGNGYDEDRTFWDGYRYIGMQFNCGIGEGENCTVWRTAHNNQSFSCNSFCTSLGYVNCGAADDISDLIGATTACTDSNYNEKDCGCY